MSIYKGQEKVLPNITTIEEEKVKQIIEETLPKIEYGTIDFVLPPGGDSSYLLTFKNTYTNIPTVVATVGSKTNIWGYYTISVSTQSNTDTCRINVHNLDAYERNLTINYIVIGE